MECVKQPVLFKPLFPPFLHPPCPFSFSHLHRPHLLVDKTKCVFLSLDVCMSLRLQQVMKSHWQGKAPERTKPLKKLSLKHKLSSKDKHIKLANSLMAHSEYMWAGPHAYEAIQYTSSVVIHTYLYTQPLESSPQSGSTHDPLWTQRYTPTRTKWR